MFNFNKATVHGDNATINQSIDNSKTIFYLTTGDPIKDSLSEKEPVPARLANWLTELPTLISNGISDNSTSEGFWTTIVKSLLMLAVFVVTIVLSTFLSKIVQLSAALSICYYLYLQVVKNQKINFNFYLQQIIIFIAVSIFHSNLTSDLQFYNQHTLSDISIFFNLDSFKNSFKDNFSFWWTPIVTIYKNHSTLTPQEVTPIFSLLFTGVSVTLSIYFYLIDSLRLIALKTKVSFLSTVRNTLILCVLVGLLINISIVASTFSQYFFSPK